MICVICQMINKDVIWTPQPHSILSVTGWRLNKTTADWLQLSPSFCVVGGLVEWRSGQCNYVCSLLLLLLLLLQSKARIKGSWKEGGREEGLTILPARAPHCELIRWKGAHLRAYLFYSLWMSQCSCKMCNVAIAMVSWYCHSTNYMCFPVK